MAFFNEFPHTRTYDSDLGWLIEHTKTNIDSLAALNAWKASHEQEYEQLKDIVEGLQNSLLEVITPWDPGLAYKIYSIVEYLGQNYIAIQDVPIGTMVTDTNYWTAANTVIMQINAIGNAVSDMQTYLYNYVTPQMFGAVADGVTDDSQAFQDAVDSALEVYVPEGNYKLESSIHIGSYKTICGAGYGTKIYFDSPNNGDFAFHINGADALSMICDMDIIGPGQNAANINGGISLDDRPAPPLQEFDAHNTLENIRIRDMSGDGVYIGSSQRGTKITKVFNYYIGGYGFNMVGTDNMIQFCAAAVCGKTGFKITQSNRLLSVKPFNCGSADLDTYAGLEIGNFNNLYEIDIQENLCTGMKITGSGNVVYFKADGNGPNDFSNNTKAIITLGDVARYNRLDGTIIQGTLSRFTDKIISLEGNKRPLGNDINLIYDDTENVDLYNVTFLDAEADPSNKIIINGNDLGSSYRALDPSVNVSPIYTGNTGWTPVITPVNGVYSYNAPISFANISMGLGVNLRLKLADLDGYTAADIVEGSRICLAFNIDSNVPNDRVIQVNASIYSGAPYAFYRGSVPKRNRGEYVGVLYINAALATSLQNNPNADLRMGLSRYLSDSYTEAMPASTDIIISNVRYQILY